jgi:hypothetical protein
MRESSEDPLGRTQGDCCRKRHRAHTRVHERVGVQWRAHRCAHQPHAPRGSGPAIEESQGESRHEGELERARGKLCRGLYLALRERARQRGGRSFPQRKRERDGCGEQLGILGKAQRKTQNSWENASPRFYWLKWNDGRNYMC